MRIANGADPAAVGTEDAAPGTVCPVSSVEPKRGSIPMDGLSRQPQSFRRGVSHDERDERVESETQAGGAARGPFHDAVVCRGAAGFGCASFAGPRHSDAEYRLPRRAIRGHK